MFQRKKPVFFHKNVIKIEGKILSPQKNEIMEILLHFYFLQEVEVKTIKSRTTLLKEKRCLYSLNKATTHSIHPRLN